MPSSGNKAARGVVLDLPKRNEAIVERRTVQLASGRSYELEAGEPDDRLTVRSRDGQVVLQVEVGDRGPVLRFDSAELELVARDKLRLKAGTVELEGTDQVAIRSGGDLDMQVSGHKHEQVAGDARLEARAVEVQANERSVRVQAMEQIFLDGSHIGLNDDPSPTPFDWSAIAKEKG